MGQIQPKVCATDACYKNNKTYQNHPNYARWIVRYHDNLLKLQETHPEVYDDLVGLA